MALFISKTLVTKANLTNYFQISNLSFFHFFPFNYSKYFIKIKGNHARLIKWVLSTKY